MAELLVDKSIYWIFIALLLIGLHAAISKSNLVKKLMGLSIFQTAIILFFVSIGRKRGAGIPILGEHDHHHPDPGLYINPVPHVLMLTAIVVGVATVGLALGIIQQIYRLYGTTEELEVIERLVE